MAVDTDPIQRAPIHVTRPIEQGCVVVVNEDDFRPKDGEKTWDWLPTLLEDLQRTAGHDRFTVLSLSSDSRGVEVYGPEDLTEALRRLAIDADPSAPIVVRRA